MFEDFIAVAIRTVVGGPKAMASAGSMSSPRSLSRAKTMFTSDTASPSAPRPFGAPETPEDALPNSLRTPSGVAVGDWRLMTPMVKLSPEVHLHHLMERTGALMSWDLSSSFSRRWWGRCWGVADQRRGMGRI